MRALGESAYFYRLSPADVGLPSALEAPGGLYLEGPVGTLYSALESAFSGPFYAVLEAGGGEAGRGRLHIHVLAHREDGPSHIRRDTERCKRVYDAPGLYRYLAKPPEPYSLEAELDYRAAKTLSPTGKLPRTRRHKLGPKRLAWAAKHNATALYDLTLSTPVSAPALNPPISSPVHARADSTKAQASRRSARSSSARVTPGAALSAFELLQGLETPPFIPQTDARIRVLEGINARDTWARRVPGVPKYPFSREGRTKRDSGGPENYLMAQIFALFGGVPEAPEAGKRSLLRERRAKRQREGLKRLEIATRRGHRLVSLASPRRPLSRVLDAIRLFLRLPRRGDPLEPVAPFPLSPEMRFKPPPEEMPADIHVWSRSPVSAALRYHSRASAPSAYGGFTHVDRPTKSRREVAGPIHSFGGGRSLPPGSPGY